MKKKSSRRRSLHTRIFLGLVIGAAAGVACNLLGAQHPVVQERVEWVIRYITGPLGRIFLNMLFMTVVPIVFSTLTTGVAHLGDLKRLSRLGGWTFLCFCVLMMLAATLGLTLVQLVRPGSGFDPAVQDRLLETYQGEVQQKTGAGPAFGIENLIAVVPRNPLLAMVNMDMLAVIFFALIVGMALTRIQAPRAQGLISLLEGVADVMMVIVGFAMQIAPYAVLALIFNVTARFGTDLLMKLLTYVVVVLGGYLVFLFGVYPLLLWLIARRNPVDFMRKVLPVMITGFSTSSSNATLPTTIKVAIEDLGIPSDIAGFVLPLGATMNMNGTALFEGVTVLFLAQVFGVELTLVQQALVVLLAVLMAIGTAGIPGGSIPMIMIVLATVNLRPDAIAIILGVDRVLDMGRTVLNVTGDMVTATFVSRLDHGPGPAPLNGAEG
ncbi:MAG TPA: dicarboxylate/amino acid:cation symporter [Acidobacteriota bacterium]|nr:dicarboxylate/amino acid:cation symporter [Acidobacteriota bacterium]